MTRDQAIAAVRKYLVRNKVPHGETIPLVAQLTMSAEDHPTKGPAWLVAEINESGRQRQLLLVDAITGNVMSTVPRVGESAPQQGQ